MIKKDEFEKKMKEFEDVLLLIQNNKKKVSEKKQFEDLVRDFFDCLDPVVLSLLFRKNILDEVNLHLKPISKEKTDPFMKEEVFLGDSFLLRMNYETRSMEIYFVGSEKSRGKKEIQIWDSKNGNLYWKDVLNAFTEFIKSNTSKKDEVYEFLRSFEESFQEKEDYFKERKAQFDALLIEEITAQNPDAVFAKDELETGLTWRIVSDKLPCYFFDKKPILEKDIFESVHYCLSLLKEKTKDLAWGSPDELKDRFGMEKMKYFYPNLTDYVGISSPLEDDETFLLSNEKDWKTFSFNIMKEYYYEEVTVKIVEIRADANLEEETKRIVSEISDLRARNEKEFFNLAIDLFEFECVEWIEGVVRGIKINDRQLYNEIDRLIAEERKRL